MWRFEDGDIGQTPIISCIQYPYSDSYGIGNAAKLGLMFHEVGHAIDNKYGSGYSRNEPISGDCTPNTSEESRPLSEAVAAIYSEVMFLDEFGDLTNFTGPNAENNALPRDFTGSRGVSVHNGDISLVCHAPTGSICNDPLDPGVKYEYSRAFIQAFWEMAHGINCDGPEVDLCDVMSALSPGVSQARWAFFYAMKESSRDSTYKEFVGEILQYFSEDVGVSEWAERYWVFNHHDLYGYDHSYTPCTYD